jgi:hypothetical protein
MKQFDELGDLVDLSDLSRAHRDGAAAGDPQDALPEHSPADDLTLGGEGNRRRRRSGVIIFGVVAIGAFASLWSMRAIGRAGAEVSGTSEAGRVVESYLSERAKLGAKPSAGSLASAPLPVGNTTELQVARERLHRDPFAPRSVVSITSTESDDETFIDPNPAEEQAARAARERETQRTAWQQAVDAGARDFVIGSVLLAADPTQSIVSLNGDVFRVGESVMFADHGIAYEIVAVRTSGVTLRAANRELECERLIEITLGEPE